MKPPGKNFENPTVWDEMREWTKSFDRRRLLPLLVIILLNIVLIFIFGAVVIYHAVYPDSTPLPVTIAPPPPPVIPPVTTPASSPDAGGASSSPLDPEPVVVPPPSAPNAAIVSTSPQTAFDAAQLANKSLNYTLRHPRGSDPTTVNSPGAGPKLGNVNFFGSTESNGVPLMTGFLYDLKLTKDKKPTNFTTKDYHKELTNFISRNWDQSILDKYYKFSKPLYSPQIFIPNISANLGPQQFKADKEILPRMWVAYYKVTVSLPEDGTYQFYGTCDDILAVKVRGNTVLDGSLTSISGLRQNSFKFDLLDEKGFMWGSLKQGIPFHMSGGVPTQIDIMIGEEPGGWFNAFLLVGKTSEKYATGPKGMPILPVFQVANCPIPNEGMRLMSAPPMVWTAVDTTPSSAP